MKCPKCGTELNDLDKPTKNIIYCCKRHYPNEKNFLPKKERWNSCKQFPSKPTKKHNYPSQRMEPTIIHTGMGTRVVFFPKKTKKQKVKKQK